MRAPAQALLLLVALLGTSEGVFEGRRFRLRAHAVPEPAARGALAAAEALYDGFLKRFALTAEPDSERRDHDPIDLYATAEGLAADPRVAAPGRVRLQGILLADDSILVARETQAGQDLTLWHLRHEVAHLLWRRLGGLQDGPEPWSGEGYWLVEGLATELEAGPAIGDIEIHRLRIAYQALKDQDLPTLGSLLKMDRELFLAPDEGRTNIHYAAAWALAHQLLARAPEQRRQAFLDYLRRVAGLDGERRREALLEALGQSLAELERDWRSGIAAAAKTLRLE